MHGPACGVAVILSSQPRDDLLGDGLGRFAVVSDHVQLEVDQDVALTEHQRAAHGCDIGFIADSRNRLEESLASDAFQN